MKFLRHFNVFGRFPNKNRSLYIQLVGICFIQLELVTSSLCLGWHLFYLWSTECRARRGRMQATRSLTNWLPAHGDCSHTSLLWADRALRPRFIRSSGPWLKLWSIERWFWLEYQVLNDQCDWNSERLIWLKHRTIELKKYWKIGLDLSIERSVRLTFCLTKVLNDLFDWILND